MNLKDLSSLGRDARGGARMPVLFVGHGNPMNAIEDNVFSRTWRDVGRALPQPAAILCISAHWETWGSEVTAMETPRTIHDFGGFPRELYQAQYPAPGSRWLAGETASAVSHSRIGLDFDWGLDHGCWSVLCRMFPEANVPVVQLSLDSTKAPRDHYALAQELAPLRSKDVLILASGNIVHNLRAMALPPGGDFNTPFALDWAREANELFKRLIDGHDHDALMRYQSLGSAVQLAVPTPEHYLPLLYALALREEDDVMSYFNDAPVAGSLTMTSLKIGPEQGGT